MIRYESKGLVDDRNECGISNSSIDDESTLQWSFCDSSESVSIKSFLLPYSLEEPTTILENRVIEIHNDNLAQHEEMDKLCTNRVVTVVNPILSPSSNKTLLKKRNDHTSIRSSLNISTLTSSFYGMNNENLSRSLFPDTESENPSIIIQNDNNESPEITEVGSWGYFVDAIPMTEQYNRSNAYRHFMLKELSLTINPIHFSHEYQIL